jgi:tRNA (mo5U34)-methyltransferase
LRIAAGDAGFERRVQELSASAQDRVRYHSIELRDGSVLPGLQSLDHLRWRLSLFNLPADLRGKRVLDIGAWDGWFSFECERRGAEVVAVDCVELDTFLEARSLLDSKVEYLTLDVDELSAARLGQFDIVLFFGVLYHLRHPMLGLQKVVELCRDTALIESFVMASEARAIPTIMEFYEGVELGGQIDNWCGPTPECLLAMCRSAGFAEVELKDVTNGRASVTARRHWPQPADHPVDTAPHLNAAVNNRTYVATFHPLKDEYLCCYFKSPLHGLTAAEVFVEVDGFGLRPIQVTAAGADAYQADCIRPPGLAPGRHEVRLRTLHSGRSNAVSFTMLDEHGAFPPGMRRNITDSVPDLASAALHPPADRRLTVNKFGTLVCYFRSKESTLGTMDVCLEVAGTPREPHTVSSLGDDVWQANLLLSEPLPPGTEIRIRFGEGPWSRRLALSRV